MKRMSSITALLIVCGLAVLCSSCEKANTKLTSAIYDEPMEIPTEDEMLVTTDVEARIYGLEEEGFGASLIRRFKNVTADFDPNTTKVCIVTDAAIRAGLISQRDCIDIYECYNNGGVVFVTSPSYEGFTVSFQPDMAVATYLQNVVKYNLKIGYEDSDGNVVTVTPDKSLYTSCFTEPKIESTAEKPYCGLGFNTSGVLYCEGPGTKPGVSESEGEIIENGEVQTKATQYQIGLRADAAVRWMESKIKLSTKATIEDLLNAAMTKTYLHDIDWFRNDPYMVNSGNKVTFNNRLSISNAFVENFTIKVAHDLKSHMDYYLITQDGEFQSNRIRPVPDLNDRNKWCGFKVSDEKVGNMDATYAYYFSYFLEWNTSMSVNFNGNSVNVVESSPQADNSTTTTTTTLTTGTMKSESDGISFGISEGVSGWAPSAMFNLALNHTWTTGTTRTCELGTTRSKKDITISKDRNGNKVIWHYNGTPGSWNYKDGDHGKMQWSVGLLQISDMTQTNSVLFSTNPGVTIGNAELTIWNEWWYRTSYFVLDSYFDSHYVAPGTRLSYHSAGNRSEHTLTLPTPTRSSQEWVLTCTDYGDAQNDFEKRAILSNNMFNQLMGGSAEYTLGDSTDKSTATARGMLNLFMQRFSAWDTYGVKGHFAFKMTRLSDKTVLTAEHIVE